MTETSADGRMSRTGEFEEYPVQAVYHAIGYKPATAPGIANVIIAVAIFSIPAFARLVRGNTLV